MSVRGQVSGGGWLRTLRAHVVRGFLTESRKGFSKPAEWIGSPFGVYRELTITNEPRVLCASALFVGQADQNIASWNQVVGWLRRLDVLRWVARIARGVRSIADDAIRYRRSEDAGQPNTLRASTIDGTVDLMMFHPSFTRRTTSLANSSVMAQATLWDLQAVSTC